MSVSFLYQWIDLLWAPIAFFAVHRHQRWMAVTFTLTCALFLRLQVELMHEFGFDHGFFKLFEADTFKRGLITYAILILCYLLLSHLSPGTKGVIYMAASISIFFICFVVSTIVMVL